MAKKQLINVDPDLRTLVNAVAKQLAKDLRTIEKNIAATTDEELQSDEKTHLDQGIVRKEDCFKKIVWISDIISNGMNKHINGQNAKFAKYDAICVTAKESKKVSGLYNIKVDSFSYSERTEPHDFISVKLHLSTVKEAVENNNIQQIASDILSKFDWKQLDSENEKIKENSAAAMMP